jgi:hypothetical protein
MYLPSVLLADSACQLVSGTNRSSVLITVAYIASYGIAWTADAHLAILGLLFRLDESQKSFISFRRLACSLRHLFASDSPRTESIIGFTLSKTEFVFEYSWV